jgi:hypothetical protein
MTKQVITFIFDIPKSLWISQNHREHFLSKANKTSRLNAMGYAKAYNALRYGARKEFETFESDIYVYHPTKTKFDASNASPTYKALLDGMITAGIAKDDNAYIHKKESYIGKTDKQSPKGTYRLVCVLKGEVREQDYE